MATSKILPKAVFQITAIVLLVSTACSLEPNKCSVKSLEKAAVQGHTIFSPNGKSYLLNKEDSSGVPQIYIGRTNSAGLKCISCQRKRGAPNPKRFKMQPRWHPSGKWIILAVERDTYTTPPILGLDQNYVEGQLQSGLWTNMYAVTPDGKKWFQLTDFQSNVLGVPDGYTGPAITSDGKTFVWSQIVDGNILTYWPFGRWELIKAEFHVKNGVPSIVNKKDITPSGMHWNEPGNFHPNNKSLLLTGSTEADAQGMDQYVLNINNGSLRNLTNSPTVWDEHGLYSPNGKKIMFMSAYPYRDDPNSSKVLSIKTDFMLMDSNGKNLIQLTNFMRPGFPGSETRGIAATPSWQKNGTSALLMQLVFPNYIYWNIELSSGCKR